SFGDSAVLYTLRFWTSDFLREPITRSSVRTRVWYAAHRAGLEIPYPTRTLLGGSQPAPAEDENELADRAQAVARVGAFSCLGETDRATVAAAMRPALFTEGEEIIREGDPGDSLFIIQRGHVEVLSGDGRRDVARLGPGDVFGEMSLMTGDRRNATCLAVSDVASWVIDHRPVRRLLETRPRLAQEVAPPLPRFSPGPPPAGAPGRPRPALRGPGRCAAPTPGPDQAVLPSRLSWRSPTRKPLINDRESAR